MSSLIGMGSCLLSSNPVLPQSPTCTSDKTKQMTSGVLTPKPYVDSPGELSQPSGSPKATGPRPGPEQIKPSPFPFPCGCTPVDRKDGPKEKHARERTGKGVGLRVCRAGSYWLMGDKACLSSQYQIQPLHIDG